MGLARCLGLALAVLLGMGSGAVRAELPAWAKDGAPKKPLEMALPEAVFLAVRNNTDIKNAYLDRVTQKFNLEVAEHKFKPDINLDANLVRSGSDTNEDFSGQPYDTDINTTQGQVTATVTEKIPTGAEFTFTWQYTKTEGDATGSYYSDESSTANSWQLAMTQPLLRGAGIDVNMASVRQARISEWQNILGLKATLIGTVTTVIYNYRAFLESGKQLAIAQRSLKRARELLEENKALIAAGRMAQSDLVQSQSNLANQRIYYQQAINQLEQNRLELLRTLNMNKNTRVLPTEELRLPSVLPTLDQALALAYANQPAYLQAKLVLDYTKQSLVLAENDQLWDLNLLVNYNYTDTRGASIGNTTENDWSAGLYMSIPIYGTTRLGRKAGLLQARSDLFKAKNSFRQAEENLNIDVDNALRDLRIKQEQVKLADLALKLSQEKLTNEQIKLKSGRSSNFVVVSYQLDLATAENTKLTAEVEFLNSLTRLDQVIGTALNTWRIAFKTQRKSAQKKVWGQ